MILSQDVQKALNSFEKFDSLFNKNNLLIENLSASYIDNLMVVFFYVDKVHKNYYIKNVMKPNFNSGLGQHIKYGNNSYIVIYGQSQGFYSKKEFFLKAYIHEYMHYLNRDIIFLKENIDLPIGHPDIKDSKFSKYFIRDSERRSYVACLNYALYQYINFVNIQQNILKDEFIKSFDNIFLFNKLKDKFNYYNLDVSSFYLLYHLVFNENNKQQAIKILEDLFK